MPKKNMHCRARCLSDRQRARQQIKDFMLSTRHSIMKEVLAIALPMVASQACDTVMIFTDRLFLSRLSPELMSAALGGGLTAFVLMTFFFGLIGYTTALVAQYLGAGKKDSCAVVVTQAFLIAFIAYPVIILCKPLAYRLFVFMGVVPQQRIPQMMYFTILLYGAIFSLFRGCLSSFFSGIGRTRIVMAASLVGMAVNIVMNYILIFGKCGLPALGISGAAYGTIIGNISGMAILACVYFSRRITGEFGVRKAFRVNGAIMKQLIRFGSPAGVEMFLNLLAFNIMILAFHGRGSVTATAATIMFNWDLVSFVPLIGIEIAITSLVGRYMGAGNPETAHHAAMAGIQVGLLYSFGILLLFTCIPHTLVSLFHPMQPDVIYEQAVPLAVFMIRMAAFYVLFDAMIVALIGALRGAGDTVWAMILMVGMHWSAATVAFITLHFWHMLPQTAWVITISAVFLPFSGIIYGRYHSGKWKEIQVIGK